MRPLETTFELHGATRRVSVEFARQVARDANDAPLSTYEYRVAQANLLVTTPTACDPPLNQFEVLRTRFALGEHLALLGRRTDAKREFDIASKALDHNWSGTEDDKFLWGRWLRWLKLDGDLLAARDVVNSTRFDGISHDFEHRVSARALDVDPLLIRLEIDALLGGPDEVMRILQIDPKQLRTTPALRGRSISAVVHDGWLDEGNPHSNVLFCKLALFHPDLHQKSLGVGLECIVGLSKSIVAQGPKQDLAAGMLLYRLVVDFATALAHEGWPPSLDPKILVELSRVADGWLKKLERLDPPAREKVPAYPWVIEKMSAACTLLRAHADADKTRKQIRHDGLLGPRYQDRWIASLWPYDQLIIHYQRIMACAEVQANPTWHVEAFSECMAAWRGRIAGFSLRSSLRVTLAWICSDILHVQRRWASDVSIPVESSRVLAEAEDVLGPGRALQEKIVTATGSSDAGQDITLRYKDWSRVFPSGGSIMQVLPVAGDLYVIETRIKMDGSARSVARPVIITGGHKALSELVTLSKAKTQRLHQHLKDFRGDGWAEQFLWQKLDDATRECARKLSDVLAGKLNIPDQVDLLIACADPELLSLPWSLMEMCGQPLIERVKSLTFNVAVGAAAALARPPRLAGGFDIAVYCHDTDRNGENALQWNRMFFDKDGNKAGFLTFSDGLGFRLRSIGVEGLDNRVADVATLNAYTEEGESDVLLVAGHGDPTKGIWLGNGCWKPEDMMERKLHLTKTECAMLPSCRLGEMQWDCQTDDGGRDPSKGEIIGFTASLCVAGIPRVLACPWICYDLPVCRLIPMIVEKAIEKRNNREPSCWARALRDVVVAGLKEPKGFRYYDLANLMLFGAP